MFKSVREVLKQVENSKNQEVHKQIAIKILQNFDQNIFLKQKELADSCFVSESTVTLFSKSLGYDGYRELYLRLKIESEYYNIKNDEKNSQSFQGNLKSIRNEMNQIFDFIDNQNEDLKIFIKEIKNSQSIHLFSSYEQVINAQNICDNLKRVCNHVSLEQIRHNHSKVLQSINKPDLVIFIISGIDNETIIQIYHNLLAQGVRTLVVASTSQAAKLIKPLALIELGTRGQEYVMSNIRNIAIEYIFSKIILNI
ncbi:MurR/RpiR family transcriptional regulator [Spiroplasma alleghenense]|uniref:HTH rpiR-type domain-containing protein n=1 Tax=Spiroplasma alleghenense TaxID=216931 RepID=A0A345Z502_9MOLU|nr:MurR/RpiR family transcriptional regulator [Spiroplasma alleghenense]AXK51681.1 hypothetical protein SALLE_v1c10110 [Spiroplasma alleghenense]